MQDPPSSPPHVVKTWGLWAVVLGALSLALVFVQIAAPMLEPKPSAASQIGEIAGEMSRAAWRSFLGFEAEAQPEPVANPYALYGAMVAPVLGVVAIVLALFSGLKGENRRFAVYGTGLGATAVVFHFFWWVALLFAGVLLLVAIIENLGSFFTLGLWD